MSDSDPKPKRSDFVPPSAEDLDAVLDAYEFIEILGKGGMGAVYKARQLSLDRLVAIKILPRVTDGDKFRFADRFQREARAMARLTHPNIVAVYDFGQTRDDQLYIVMEYVDGTDLQKLIRTGQLTVDHLFGWMAQICDALQYAHNQGIVHRDIKPANIMINREGGVKIADFGLAKLTRTEDAQNTRLTMTNVVMGTPEYLAPEALEGEGELDHRADLYAVGVMLYEMLTGKIPRGAWSPPSEVKPGIDPRFDELVDRAMNADPDSRFQSASEISEQLTGIWKDSAAVQGATPGDGKLKLQAANSRDLTESRAIPKPSSSSVAARPRKSSPGLIFGGIAAATVVLGGIAAFLLPGGRGDKNVVDDAAAPAAAVASSVPVTPPKAMASTPPDGSFENSLGMKFVHVPGTDVLFCIHEVRWKDYAAYANENPAIAGGWRNQTHDGYVIREKAEDHPVVGVDWEDANAFCGWLSKREGRTYRLPTDHEWSMAVGIGTREDNKASPQEKNRKIADEYPWGSEWPPPQGMGNYSDQSRKAKAPGPKMTYLDRYDDGFPTTASVMSFKPNQFGIYDIGGNVWEWVLDKYYPSSSSFVLRGGSWSSYSSDDLLSSIRNERGPTNRYYACGFRCVVSTGAAAKRVDPPLTEVHPKATLSVESPQATPADPLADLPGLQTRLTGYLNARNTQLTELATQYSRGLDSRINQAAAAGDLTLTSAYGEEKARVAALVSSLGAPVTDPRGAVRQSPALPKLPSDSPGPLVALRQTWTSESGKILATLEASLQQSLQALEAELTRASDLEKAKAVQAYRESLTASFTLARATKDVPFENSLGMKFVPVPGTNVLMCIHETRRGDYAKFAAQNAGLDGTWSSPKDGDNYPVAFVNWHEATAFCEWLTQREGLKHRLPTDREWSFGIGIGSLEDSQSSPEVLGKLHQGIYPWGNTWPPPNNSGNYWDAKINELSAKAGVQASYADGFNARSPVMSFPANSLGLHDLDGNVLEWCEDWYNPQKSKKVLRGISIVTGMTGLGDFTSSRRRNASPENREDRFAEFGFRCVIELPSSVASGIAPAVVQPAVPAISAPVAGRASVSAAPPASAAKDAPFENSLGMKFVPVPGTEVLFCIHEVRWKDWAAYAKVNQDIAPNWKDQTCDGFVIKDKPEDHPVTRVNWEDVNGFCAWLTKKEIKEGRIYRLPTDHEWSLAVGIGKNEDRKATPKEKSRKVADQYLWGSDWPPPKGAGNYSDQSRKARAPNVNFTYIEAYDDGFPSTAPVMSFKPNEFGLYDLGGNVWEWCQDLYAPSSLSRVVRGGSWCYSSRENLLSTNRSHDPPTTRNSYLGFRCVLVFAGEVK